MISGFFRIPSPSKTPPPATGDALIARNGTFRGPLIKCLNPFIKK